MRQAKDDLASSVVPAIQRIVGGHEMKHSVVIGLKASGLPKDQGIYIPATWAYTGLSETTRLRYAENFPGLCRLTCTESFA